MARNMFLSQFRWLSAAPLLMVVGALAVIALMALANAQSTQSRSREALFDFYQRLSPSSASPSEAFHIVAIDRESVEAVGPWPWPRTIIAQLISAAAEAGAEGVVLTEPVDAPDPLSPETIGEFWLSGARDDALAQQLSLLPKTDAALADAFSLTQGAAAVSQTPPTNPHKDSALARADVSGAEWITTAREGGLALPAARLLYGVSDEIAATSTLSVGALIPDSDGIVRRVPLLWSLDGAPAPSLGLKAALVALNAPTVTAGTSATATGTHGAALQSLMVGEHKLPLGSGASLRLDWPKRLAIPKTSAAKLLSGAGSFEHLQGSVIFIGLDEELTSTLRTPRGALTPANIHALAASQVVKGDAVKRPMWTGYLEAMFVMLLGAAAIMISQRVQFWRAIGFAALVSVILMMCAFAAFSFSNLMLNPLPGALALFIGALSVAGGKSIGGVLRDDSARGSFRDTLPEATLKVLREGEEQGLLDGIYRPVTVLACELRLADEDLRTMENLPDEVTKIIAAASLDLRQTIISTGAAADQGEGGRIYAYFNAPLEVADHVQAGCAAALRLIESMDKINDDLENSSRTRGMQVHLAIGVATGECFVGSMGHGRNNRYSAIGPAVDRAVFLRNQSEIYGPAMIVDETIYRQTHHHFAFLELDKLRTRHADRPMSIYALIGNPFIKSSKGYRTLEDSHRQLLTAYRAGDFAKAREMLDKAKQSPGAKIALFDIYEERIQKMIDEGAPDGWDGVHAESI